MLPKRLLQGYANFRSGRYTLEADRYRQLGDGMQKPKIMLIACCDSRAAPETIFDTGPGEMFVVRNVANLVPPYAPDGKHHSTSAALEFAVLSLEVEHLVVMGHGRCGGIRAMVEPGDPLSSSDFIGRWMSGVAEIADQERKEHPHLHGHDLHRVVERASVEHSIANLRTFPWIRAKQMKQKISLHGAWFDIAEGAMWAYDEGNHAWAMIPSA